MDHATAPRPHAICIRTLCVPSPACRYTSLWMRCLLMRHVRRPQLAALLPPRWSFSSCLSSLPRTHAPCAMPAARRVAAHLRTPLALAMEGTMDKDAQDIGAPHRWMGPHLTWVDSRCGNRAKGRIPRFSCARLGPHGPLLLASHAPQSQAKSRHANGELRPAKSSQVYGELSWAELCAASHGCPPDVSETSCLPAYRRFRNASSPVRVT
jgi:hypothetical protein